MRKHTLITANFFLFFCLFIACGDNEEAENGLTEPEYFIQFTIDGINFIFEEGISGKNPDNEVDLTGDPASYGFDSPGMIMLEVYATQSQVYVNNFTAKTNGFLRFFVNENCTNANQYDNVSFRFKHPEVEGLYYENGLSVNITEFGEVDTGVVSGTFSITLTNETQLDEITLESGIFRVRHLIKDAGTSIINNLYVE